MASSKPAELTKPAPPAGSERVARLAFASCVVIDAVWLLLNPRLSGARWPALLAVVGCHIWCVLTQRRTPTVTTRSLLSAFGALLVLAIVRPPYGSNDVWSYAVYGRIVAIHHASPYTHSPGDFPLDPLTSRVGPLWLHSPSVYGPVWNYISALGALFFRSSALTARLYFQLLTAASLSGSVLIMIRKRVAMWVVVLVALSPGMLIAVNQAHVDMLVAFGLLLALVLVTDRRFLWAGVALGITLLCKVVVVPAVGGVVLALLLARRWRPALTVTGAVAAVVGVGYALAGGMVALKPVQHGSTYVGRASISAGLLWAADQLKVTAPQLLTHANARSALFTGLAVIGFGIFAWKQRKTPDPATFAVAAMVIYLVTANYVLAWYAIVALPAAALVRTRLRWYAFACVVLMQFSYIRADHHHLPAPDFVAHIAPLFEVGLLALVIWRTDRPRPSTPTVAGHAPRAVRTSTP